MNGKFQFGFVKFMVSVMNQHFPKFPENRTDFENFM